MPESVTKNAKDRETLLLMCRKAFGEEPVLEIEELSEGYFNVAYRIRLEGRSVILKIAPSGSVAVMTQEKNIMFSEVDSMRMVAAKTKVPVAEVLFYDDSRTVCDSDYFFMEQLDGKSFWAQTDELTEQEKESIFFQTGVYTRMLNELEGERFGYYGQPDRQGSRWFPVFCSMIEDVYRDAEKKNVALPVKKEKMLACLERDAALFEEVTIPRFVHWDIWAGNVFVKDGRVTGIIDFERCLWADPLMEVGFRTYGYEEAFFKGYGKAALTPAETRRAQWYDLYLFLTNALECDFRQYGNYDMYHWACRQIEKRMAAMFPG